MFALYCCSLDDRNSKDNRKRTTAKSQRINIKKQRCSKEKEKKKKVKIKGSGRKGNKRGECTELHEKAQRETEEGDCSGWKVTQITQVTKSDKSKYGDKIRYIEL